MAKAQLEKDRANLEYAQLTYDRNARVARCPETVRQRQGARPARAQLGVDRATIQQREAQLEAAQVNLGYTISSRGSMEPRASSRNVTVGQTVAASFQTPTLFLIATDLTKMQVDTNVSESDIGGIKPTAIKGDLYRRCLPENAPLRVRSARCVNCRRIYSKRGDL